MISQQGPIKVSTIINRRMVMKGWNLGIRCFSAATGAGPPVSEWEQGALQGSWGHPGVGTLCLGIHCRVSYCPLDYKGFLL